MQKHDVYAAGWWLVAAAAVLAGSGCSRGPTLKERIAEACAQPPFESPELREISIAAGYKINTEFDCIDKQSYIEVEREGARVVKERAAAEAAQQTADAGASTTLAAARSDFATRVSVTSGRHTPFPSPPAELFVRSDYQSAAGKLAAWVTPDPGDGEKHPAIVWLTGGDSSSLDDFWTEGGANNDQSASAFRKAGVIMMFPTLRGGNENPGAHEYFLGEVDDVIAAANHLASLPYVGSIYLGGHSTGGTLALLVAETSNRFEGVFAFGPVSKIERYPQELVPVDFADLPALESKLRSPIHWLEGVSSFTYLIEGGDSPGNAEQLEALCAKTRNSFVRCVPVAGKNHFSVLDAANRKIAARLVTGAGAGEDKPLLTAAEFDR